MEVFGLNASEQILLTAGGVFLLVQLLYYLYLYNRIYRRQKAIERHDIHFTHELQPLSVIIYSREETRNLRDNLPAILGQDYPQFEVIVINDGHSNESEDFLTETEERYPNFYHSFVPESSRYISRKKLAITIGIRASKYGWLVLTDANCRPQSNQWLRTMARNFTSRAQVVLGYSGYERGHGWLHKRIAYDNLFTSMRYLGFALSGYPYMGIGRNLAYRKDLFYKQKGFSAHLNLRRGDDDLFINQVATRENTRVETGSESVMRMQPASYPKEWKEEKIGYSLTARFYHGAQRWLAGFETATRLLFYLAWAAGVVTGILHARWLVAGIAFLPFLLRFGVQAFVMNKTAKALGEKRRYYLTLPVFDWLQAIQSLQWKLHCLFRKKSEFLRK